MIRAAAEATPPANCCPRCNAPDGIQRLLTSMVRYYVCGRCDCRWQISRDLVNDDEVEVERPDSVLHLSVANIHTNKEQPANERRPAAPRRWMRLGGFARR
jgi:hypothetical protein